jgi:hypothetical protein
MATKTMDQYSQQGERLALAASKNNQLNMYKSEWTSAKNILTHAPHREKKAEKDYYHASDRHTVYNNILEKRYRAEAKKHTDEWDNYFLPKVDNINSIHTIFRTQRSYVDNLDDVEYNYKTKYNTLKQKVNDTGLKKKIADRLSKYTDDRDEYVDWAKNILSYIYYLAVFVIIPIAIWKKQYITHKKIIFYLIFFFFLPYGIRYILRYIQTNVEHIKLDKKYIFYAITVYLLFKMFPYLKRFPKKSALKNTFNR